MQYTYCLISREVKATWETFFLKNHTQNAVDKLVPDHFLKNWNWAYLRINSLTFYTVCFYCMPYWGLSQYIEIKLQTPCLYLILSFFKKNRKRSGTPPYFWHTLYSSNWQSFIVWLGLVREILGNMCIAMVC